MRNLGKSSTTLVFAVALLMLLLGVFSQGTLTKTAEVRSRESTLVQGDAAQQLIIDYYQAISTRRYQDAYKVLSARYQTQLPYNEFVKMYRDYVSSVEAVSIQLMPASSTPTRQEFQVEFNTGYIKGYPAGNGELPTFHILVANPSQPGQWLLDGISTNP